MMKYKIDLHYNFVEDLKYILDFANKYDNYRPVLTQINIGIEEGQVYIIATDSYKLVKAIIGKIDNKTIKYNNIFPATFFELIANEPKFKEVRGKFIIDLANDYVGIQIGINEYLVSETAGAYPKIEELFKSTTQYKFKKEWYQKFIYKFRREELYACLNIKTKDNKNENAFFDKDFFDKLLKFKYNENVKIYHNENVTSPVIFEISAEWEYKILILPKRG